MYAPQAVKLIHMKLATFCRFTSKDLVEYKINRFFSVQSLNLSYKTQDCGYGILASAIYTIFERLGEGQASKDVCERNRSRLKHILVIIANSSSFKCFEGFMFLE